MRLVAPRRPAGATPKPTGRLLRNAAPLAVLMSLTALAVVGADAVRGDPLGGAAVSAPGTTGREGGAPAPVTAASDNRDGTTATGSSRCVDAPDDRGDGAAASLDLVTVTLQREAKALRFRFELSGAPKADADAGGWWEVLLADDEAVLYGLSVSRDGEGWTAGLVDFTGSSEDRIQDIKAPAGKVIDVSIPAGQLRRLPDTFTWWATTISDSLLASEAPFADACPDAAGELDDGNGTGLPAVDQRMAFPG